MTHRVGIVGVTGYTGAELLRILPHHPELELVYAAAGASAGQPLAGSWPGFEGLVDLDVERFDPERVADTCDVVFMALPHGHTAEAAPRLLDAGLTVVDLGADFRLKDPTIYARYYGMEHPCPERIEAAVYGLPEVTREDLRGAKLIANPGCFPTAVTLAAKPLVDEGLADGPLFAPCITAVSGAGRKPGPRNLYCETSEAVQAYAVAGAHRHTPEIEQTLGHPVVFTPHLAPMNRGLSATVHARLSRAVGAAELQELFVSCYGFEPMVQLRDTPPSTADVRGSNRAHVHVAVDEERHTATVVCVIDNLVKGASGQAVQALNAALGLPEATGLPLHPLVI